MIDEPVQNRSGRVMNPNCAEVHSTSSSEIRERWFISSAAAAQNSIAKSRSATLSREFRVGASKPSISALASRSIGKVVPASAAAPKGETFNRFRQSARRPWSRSSISFQANRWWPKVTGWATCR